MKIIKSMDGNTAAAHIAYALSEVCAIYPITPSTSMGELIDAWSIEGRKNIFGQPVKVVEMQSEGGAAGTVHGALAAGSLSSTFTASQGLLLMIPNMYKMAGELLPAVFHVSSRALAGQALSIFGDHQDVMATRATGFCMLSSSSVQECMDLSLVSHLSSIRSSLPFIHFFDGFRTSSEIQKIEVIDYEDIPPLVDFNAIKNHRQRALNPEHPHLRGSAQNPDIYFQATEAANKFYNAVPQIVEEEMKKIKILTNREYHLFEYEGHPDAEEIIVIMGSAIETVAETVKYLNSQGQKLGVVKVLLYRPFSIKHFLSVIPKTVKKIAVLNRTKESGSTAEPLYLDVVAAFNDAQIQKYIITGRYGLGSKDFTPGMVKTVFDNLRSDNPKNHFTIGIIDDVTNTSLNDVTTLDLPAEQLVQCKFWGIGGDGTVGANKNAIKIIGDNTEKQVQGYFAYDSKKAGGVTISHLRFGNNNIKMPYLIQTANYIACHNASYVKKYDVIEGLKPNGIFVLNSPWTIEDMEKELPNNLKRYIAQNNIQFYNINALDIAKKMGLGGRINMIMQTAFFKLANIFDVEKAIDLLKKSIAKTYAKKGEKIIKMNQDAVDATISALKKIDYPLTWKDLLPDMPSENKKRPDFIRKIADIINAQKGDTLPVSAFMPGGIFPTGTTQYEKRAIAINLPQWLPENCIQCNMCSFICPHAAIRPFLLTEEQVKKIPSNYKLLKPIGKGFEGLQYCIAISPLDCVGCEKCAISCPAPKAKALVMKNFDELVKNEEPVWDFLIDQPLHENVMNKFTIKGSQYNKPLMEFSGACVGCGETAYVKLLTQLFGDRMIIANATGCSSIWGGSAPSIPWTVNDKGYGPAWGNSLFEDNAEYGYGIQLGIIYRREELKTIIKTAIAENISTTLKELLQEWLQHMNEGDKTRELAEKIKPLLEKEPSSPIIDKILQRKDLIAKPSVWIIGGDGWAYDIGFGGLDHVLAQNVDIKILVLDTEVYSNTGGQASKATQLGAIAKFAASGKRTIKKDLGLMAMSYGHAYVASVVMGSDPSQVIKAFKEAESYNGPAIIIAYASCIAHGIKEGMEKELDQEKKAVESGYLITYRYDPRLKLEGKNPLQLDSKEPTQDVSSFLEGQIRYSSLKNSNPEIAKKLEEELKEELKNKYKEMKKLSE
jgi:pyruvate-ferredoxin/flavodoxin oxidoreductase